MDDLTKVMAKEKLSLLNREIEILEKERDDLLGVCLVINRVIRIRQFPAMHKHASESRMGPPPTIIDYICDFLTYPDLLFFLFIILSIYGIFLG